MKTVTQKDKTKEKLVEEIKLLKNWSRVFNHISK
jgi:hypothetical protein